MARFNRQLNQVFIPWSKFLSVRVAPSDGNGARHFHVPGLSLLIRKMAAKLNCKNTEKLLFE